MKEYPILVSWKSNPSPESLDCQVLTLDYDQDSELQTERSLPKPTVVAEGALARGWGLGRGGDLIPWVEKQSGWRRRGRCRLQRSQILMSVCGWYGFWVRSSPFHGEADQIWMWCRRSGAKRLIWEQPGSQILALEWDPWSNGLWLAASCPQGGFQLLYLYGREVRCWLRHRFFEPSHFAISVSGRWLVFIHRKDNHIYRLDLATRRLTQLSQARAEWECREGFLVYRHSLQLSPDSESLFYATHYLPSQGLASAGNLYTLSAREPGIPGRLRLEGVPPGTPVSLHVPNAVSLSSALLLGQFPSARQGSGGGVLQ